MCSQYPDKVKPTRENQSLILSDNHWGNTIQGCIFLPNDAKLGNPPMSLCKASTQWGILVGHTHLMVNPNKKGVQS